MVGRPGFLPRTDLLFREPAASSQGGARPRDTSQPLAPTPHPPHDRSGCLAGPTRGSRLGGLDRSAAGGRSKGYLVSPSATSAALSLSASPEPAVQQAQSARQRFRPLPAYSFAVRILGLVVSSRDRFLANCRSYAVSMRRGSALARQHYRRHAAAFARRFRAQLIVVCEELRSH